MGASGPKPGPLVAPLLLRLALGVTFIWAGLGKLVPIVDYKGEDAAILANLGTGVTPTHPVRTTPAGTEAPALAPPPTLPLPDAPAPKPAPSKNKPTSRQQKPPTTDGYASGSAPLAAAMIDELPAAASTTTRDKAKVAGKAGAKPQPGQAPTQTTPVTPPATKAATGPAADTLPPGGKYTAADFPEPARTRRAYALSVMMVKAAYPQPSPGVQNPKAYWPAMFATSPWVVWMAFGVAVVELFAGVLVLVGFLTRLSALMLVFVMLTAMWLTQIGPAVSIGQTTFGFLPDKTWWDPAVWTPFFWQLLIIASGIAVVCLGSGALSVDRALSVIGSNGPKAEQDPDAKG